jgi:hypothetical protein
MTSVKKGMLTAAALILLGTGATGISSAFAAEHSYGDGAKNIIQALADKFGVSTDEVQSVFDEQRELVRANQTKKAAERLTQAVSDGTLTQAQADAITAHHSEMETFVESLQEMTPEERKDAQDEQREANATWAKEHDIPEDFFRTPHEGRQGHRGMPGMHRAFDSMRE